MTMNRKMTNILLLICTSLLAAGVLSCQENGRDLPDVPVVFQRWCQDLTFESQVVGETVRYSVYLPADYNTDKEKRYSVVYMLHGYGDDNNSWNGKYLHANDKIQSLEASGMNGMIYVFPYGKNSYYCNTYDGKYRYMDMFVNELVPLIDKSLRTIPDREHRAVTGYSMGGFGAMVLAEKHPEVFSCSAPLSMSFRTDAQYMAESQSGWNGQWGSIFGGVGVAGYGRLTDYYKQHCPFYQFIPANRDKLSRVHWFFTCGDDEEQLLVANDSLHVLLRDNGYAHEFRTADGAHTSSYWMNALNEVLPMFDFYMNKGGEEWPGINRDLPKIPSAVFAEDGTLASNGFKSAGKGTGVFVVFDEADKDVAGEVMAYLFNPESSFEYIFLPCNLSEKTFTQWREYYDGYYLLTSEQALAFGAAGQSVCSANGISRYYLVDARLADRVEVDPGKQYIFVNTDNGVYYKDMAELYKSCKYSGAKFEYRIIKGYPDRRSNVLKSIETIKSHFIY